MSRYLAVALAAAPSPSQTEALAPLFERCTDRVQALPPGRWLLDLAGMESALGPAAQVAARLADALAGLGHAAWLGLGPTRTAALLLSGRRQRLSIIAAADPAAALAALPIAALTALAGYGPDAACCCELFERWGLRRLGEVAQLPPRALSERLGRAGLDCQRWARGQDVGLLAPAPAAPAPLALAIHFEPALDGYLPLVPWLEAQLRQQAARLAACDRAWAGAALELTLDGARLHQPAPWPWRQRFPLPHRDPRRLLTQLETALAQQPPTAPIRAARLTLEPAAPRRMQSGLFGDARQQSEHGERLAARLRALLDYADGQRCGSPRVLDLHRRDRLHLAPFASAAAALPAPPVAWTGSRRALRVQRPPPLIRVEMAALPVPAGEWRLEGARCALPRRAPERVRRAWGPWRTSGEWWSEAAWSRDEWDVELDGRRHYRLLYDRRARRWFLLGAYD